MSAFDTAMRELWHAPNVHEFFVRLGHALTLPNPSGCRGTICLRRLDLEAFAVNGNELQETMDMVPSEGVALIDVADRRFVVRRITEKIFNYRKQTVVEQDVWVFHSIVGFFDIYNHEAE